MEQINIEKNGHGRGSKFYIIKISVTKPPSSDQCTRYCFNNLVLWELFDYIESYHRVNFLVGFPLFNNCLYNQRTGFSWDYSEIGFFLIIQNF